MTGTIVQRRVVVPCDQHGNPVTTVDEAYSFYVHLFCLRPGRGNTKNTTSLVDFEAKQMSHGVRAMELKVTAEPYLIKPIQ
jgi:hypothetical protein